ncbi:MAG: Rieske (2Fe-2S) protein [Chloroflexi bacterium]|nr:Rieske (2Fe-2S) protein [Chloroflexota bacterium]
MNASTQPHDLPPITSTRRGFIKWLLGTSVVATVAGVFVPVIGYLWPPARKGRGYSGPTMVAALADIPVGTGTVVPVDDKPVIIVNTAAGGVKAFSAICTHLGCVVDWNKGKNVIQSPCHDGRFNPVTGDVVSGPPPRALPAYELSVKDGKIYVGKPLGQIYGA